MELPTFDLALDEFYSKVGGETGKNRLPSYMQGILVVLQHRAIRFCVSRRSKAGSSRWGERWG